MLERWWDRGPIYPPWGDRVPELTAHELKVLTRPRLSIWLGVFWMAWAGVLACVPIRSGRELIRWIVAPLTFVVGFWVFLLAARWQAEREKVMRSLKGAAFTKSEGGTK